MNFPLARHAGLTVLLPLIGAIGYSSASDNAPRAMVQRAVERAGGEAALAAIRSRRTTYVVTVWNVGQERFMGAEPPVAAFNMLETLHFERGTTMSQTFFPGTLPRTAPAMMVAGHHAALRGIDSVMRPFPAGSSPRPLTTLERRRESAPEQLLLALLRTSPAAMRLLPARKSPDGRRLAGLSTVLGSDSIRVWFDEATGLLQAVERPYDDPVRATAFEMTSWSDWRPVGPAARLPSVEREWVGGVVRMMRVSVATQLNAAAADSIPAIPDEMTRPVEARETVSVRELAPGIIRLEGGNGVTLFGGGIPYYSIAVTQGDSMIVIELPNSDERARQVLDTLAARFPRTPARAFVITHGHFDHIGGSRQGFARGLRVIAPQELTPLLRGIGLPAGRPLRPARVVTPVVDSLTVGNGPTSFTLYRVPSSHADPMLIAWFPSAGLLVESDLFGAASRPDALDLKRFVLMRGLPVKTIAGAHDTLATWQAFTEKVK